jgi:hypothetical protein
MLRNSVAYCQPPLPSQFWRCGSLLAGDDFVYGIKLRARILVSLRGGQGNDHEAKQFDKALRTAVAYYQMANQNRPIAPIDRDLRRIEETTEKVLRLLFRDNEIRTELGRCYKGSELSLKVAVRDIFRAETCSSRCLAPIGSG